MGVSMLDIQKISSLVLNKLYSVGWAANRHTDSAQRFIDEMIQREGYAFFGYAYEVITALDGISFGFAKEELTEYSLTACYGEIEFSVSEYGIGIFDPTKLRAEYSENVVPFGAINGQIILLVGESQRIYADMGKAGHETVGENIEDFLNRCVR